MALTKGRKLHFVLIFLVFLAAFVLRFVNLGYSDYQGDEIKAFYNPVDQTPIQFLLSQKKGPVQFLVTMVLRGVSDSYRNHLITRFPFALAGFSACVFFYLFIKKITNERVALYSTIFFVTNGFFIAFSRIVQYQSLVLFLILLSLYLCVVFIETNKIKYFYFASAVWCIGLLTHSDSIFIAPLFLSLLVSWALKTKLSFGRFIRKVLPVFLIVLAVLLSFYIPLILSSSSGTQDYWLGRFTGSFTTGIPSSTYLFGLYQPIYGLYIYILLGGAGLVLMFPVLLLKLKAFKTIKNRIGTYLPDSIFKDPIILAGLFSSFIFALLFMEVLTKYPGTHIWTYIFPLCVFMGITLYLGEQVFNKFNRFFREFYYAVLLILFLFLFAQSYFIFVDHAQEYPWGKQKFLFWQLPLPNSKYQLSLFGFPYFRHWDDIADYIKADAKSSYYSVNERSSIASYYIPLEKDSDKAGYFIHIVKPQTLTNVTLNARGADWMKNNKPVKIFTSDGNVVARIYLVPEDWDIK